MQYRLGKDNWRPVLTAVLLASSSLSGTWALMPGQAMAQGGATGVREYDVAPGALADVLNDFAEQSGLRLVYAGELVAGRASEGLRGRYSPAGGLSQLLGGSGLSWRIEGSTVTLERAPQASASAIQLGTIRVEGAATGGGGSLSGDGTGEGDPVEAPYRTAGAVNHISGERIERFRGSSPSDIFRGTPGVLSGDSRNSSGAIDINIRGLQGQGRVRMSVDGAENAVTVYLGYLGQTNRTFIDPDFIASIDIDKGLNVASRGAAGSVEMRTIKASDIVRAGEKWGIRVKGGLGTNTSPPRSGVLGGYTWPGWFSGTTVPVASPEGLDRPATFKPTSGSLSFVAALKEEDFDLLLGYAYRDQGNYHAGENGGKGVVVVPVRAANGSYSNSGLTEYRYGEEILNTELRTESWLAKASFRFEDGHSAQLGYNLFRSEGGFFLSTLVNPFSSQPSQMPHGATTGSKLDTVTLNYRWKPEDNDLIDIRANAWLTWFQFLTQGRLYPPVQYSAIYPSALGLPEDYRTGVNTLMWGVDVSNRSQFTLDGYGDLDLSYGLSFMQQEAKLGRYVEVMNFLRPSHGKRDESGAFVKATWKPRDWLTVDGGLRYSRYWANGPVGQGNYDSVRNAGGASPSLGVTFVPFKDTQVYVNYSSAQRLPSLMESVGVFTVVQPGLRPERLRSWDVGINHVRKGLFSDNDRALIKFGYFDWDVKDYISRATQSYDGYSSALRIHNIHGAQFKGLELSTRYENAGFTAEFSANHYTDIVYCVEADLCGNISLYGDYATNHVPPKQSYDLTLSQKLFRDRLTLGGRIQHNGKRAAGHGRITQTGASAFIPAVLWKPYTLLDIYGEYKITGNLKASLRVENLTDQYYVDPLGVSPQPAPGRTIYVNLTADFGGTQSLPQLSGSFDFTETGTVDWSGFYGGVFGGFGKARTKGATGLIQPDAHAAKENAAMVAADESARLGFHGGQAGLQIGYNWQFANRVVVGIEADWGKSWIGGSQDNLAVGSNLSALYDRYSVQRLQSETHHDIDWTASLRGRAGYALGRTLAYGTGGLIVLREKVSRDQHRYSNYLDVPYWVDKDNAVRTGITGGVGIEHALNSRWSLKTEYSYSHFRARTYVFPNARAFTGTSADLNTVNGRIASNKLNLQSLKVGLNYRF